MIGLQVVVPKEDALSVVGKHIVDDLWIGGRCSSFALGCDSTGRRYEVCTNILIRISAIVVHPVGAGFVLFNRGVISDVCGRVP